MVCKEIPARKADIVSAICKAMLGPNLKSNFERLDKIDRAARTRKANFLTCPSLTTTTGD